ncbi:8216_t:CDS:1, partial [Acaulospora morrowiae]
LTLMMSASMVEGVVDLFVVALSTSSVQNVEFVGREELVNSD